MENWTQHILFSLHGWEMLDLIQESLVTGTAVIFERYVWSGEVYSYVGNQCMPLQACDQGILQCHVVVVLTTSPQEFMWRRDVVSPQSEDEEIQQKLWDSFARIVCGRRHSDGLSSSIEAT